MAKDRKTDGPRFEVRTPSPGFKGERLGVRFVDGAGTTDDQDVATELVSLGYEVKDLETGKTRGARRCRFTVRAAKDFNGDVLGVRFRDGRAGFDEPSLARAFRDRGYDVAATADEKNEQGAANDNK